MGIDFHSCEECGETFDDCGDYWLCLNEDCGTWFCGDSCLIEHGNSGLIGRIKIQGQWGYDFYRFPIVDGFYDIKGFDGETGYLCGKCTGNNFHIVDFTQWICQKYKKNYKKLLKEYKQTLLPKIEIKEWRNENGSNL